MKVLFYLLNFNFMTSTYNRSQVYSFNELTEQQQNEILDIYGFELSDAHETSYVKYLDKDKEISMLPLNMFMKTDRKNNFTHGIYGLSAFSAYFITFDRCNEIAVVAYKHF